MTKGIRTTCASKILENYVPPYDATVIKKLREKGAIIIGKTNLDEFAMGSSTEYSAFFKTLNPHDESRVPGGSSGGSASCVANDEAIAALGSDTGGSIRQPASFCGVVGFKPTYGLVSRYGLVAFASSLDQIGPITKTVEDCAILLEVISGKDDNDMTSLDVPVPSYYTNLKSNIEGLRIGIIEEFFAEVSSDLVPIYEDVLKTLKSFGIKLVKITLPHIKYAIPTYYLIATSEASSNLARYDGVRYGLNFDAHNIDDLYEVTRANGFGKEVTRRIMLGTFSLQAGYYDEYYLKACKVRQLIINDFENAFKEVDLIVTPTTPTTAFKFGEKLKDPIEMYLQDIFTVSVNLAYLPAISIPCGKVNELPVGLQFIAPRLEEQRLLDAAQAVFHTSLK